MKNGVVFAAHLNTDGLHESAAGVCAVTGPHVNVLAPETLRAVVGVSVSVYKKPTLLAGEVFLCTLKFFSGGHEMIQQAMESPALLRVGASQSSRMCPLPLSSSSRRPSKRNCSADPFGRQSNARRTK